MSGRVNSGSRKTCHPGPASSRHVLTPFIPDFSHSPRQSATYHLLRLLELARSQGGAPASPPRPACQHVLPSVLLLRASSHRCRSIDPCSSVFVEQDYVLVVFAAGATNAPSWTWLMSSYRRLGRSFRKNLKSLVRGLSLHAPSAFLTRWYGLMFALCQFIVHPTFWTKSKSAISSYDAVASCHTNQPHHSALLHRFTAHLA